MDISRVLGHLHDIHDAPDDGRDFVAFEKRPEMIVAGVPAEAFDRFDFSKRATVRREMDALSGGGPIRSPGPSLPQAHDLVYRGDPVGTHGDYDGTGGQMLLGAFGGGLRPDESAL
jgi:hypothetical protein